MKLEENQIKHMVDRFLMWRFPENISPDGGLSFKKTFNDHLPTPSKYEPTGTNLLSAEQATAMVKHMLEGLPFPELAKPDWPPRLSAEGLPEGHRRFGSTGQLFEVRDSRWVRVPSGDK